MPISSLTALAALLIGIVTLASGCCQPGTMKSMNVEVIPDPRLRNERGQMTPIEVNLVAVSDADYARWANYPMSQYWSIDDPIRSAARRHIMHFSAAEPDRKVLKKDHPIWRQWRETKGLHLFVLAFMPHVGGDQAGARDPRRLIVPLDQCAWPGTDTVRVHLQPAGLMTTDRPKALEK